MANIIHRWTEPGLGSVNTYWIETETGVVVIDGQRELSKAHRILEQITATGKPIVAVFLTHPHPDHFGGLGVFAPKGSTIPVYASRTTKESLAEDRSGFIKLSKQTVGADFPEEVTLPNHLLHDGQVLSIAGLRLQVREMGLGEAECMTTIEMPLERAFFCADIVQHRMTPFLLEGRSAAWLEQLTALEALTRHIDTLYPGHGEPGAPQTLIAEQREYLQAFRSSVLSQIKGGKLGDEGTQHVASSMEAQYPGFAPVAAIPDLLTKNAEPIAKELDQEPS